MNKATREYPIPGRDALRGVLCEGRDGRPLVSVHNLPGLDAILTPAQSRALVSALHDMAVSADIQDQDGTHGQSTNVRKLRLAVRELHSLNQEACRGIASIAALSLLAMERPEAYLHPSRMADALIVIQTLAEAAEINATNHVERVGCDDADPREERRAAAWIASQQAAA
jgi:hypothetical protein